MAKDVELALTSAMHEMRVKYIYFLLTATGACIGFAVTQTRDAVLSSSMIPIALAATCWALSFFYGCRSLYWRPVAIGTNLEIIEIKAGRNAVAGAHPEAMRIGVEVMTKNFEMANSKAALGMRLQFALFLAGSISFLTWHALEVLARTGSSLT